MGIWLSLKRVDDDKIDYSVSIAQRAVFAGIAIVIFFALVSATGRVFQSANILSLSLIAICLLASVYVDDWRFNRATATCEHKTGIPGLLRVREYSLSHASLRLVTQKLPARKSYISLLLVIDDGSLIKLDMVRGSGETKLQTVGKDLAEFCALPLEEQTD